MNWNKKNSAKPSVDEIQNRNKDKQKKKKNEKKKPLSKTKKSLYFTMWQGTILVWMGEGVANSCNTKMRWMRISRVSF